jgi:hypothetical protein
MIDPRLFILAMPLPTRCRRAKKVETAELTIRQAETCLE